MDLQEKRMEATRKVRYMAETLADLDETRPKYHFHGPALWGDDPSGFAFYKGYYHMMYGSNPDSYKVGSGMPYRTPNNRWSPEEPEYFDSVALWGHARSKDMIHWEHMPYVCYPDIENDEYFIWWGCTQVNDQGVPVIIYTSLGRRRGPAEGAQQRMLIGGDDDLLNWVHYENNPIMTNDIHGEQFIYQWRDPFIFRSEGKAYMVLGGKLGEEEGGDCVVLLYEAENGEFTKWKYKGIFFKYPEDVRKSMECPLVARLNNKWVLIVSPHGPVEYFAGDIDFSAGEFHWETKGFVDRGRAFYAPNLVYDDKGRCIMFAAVEGFKDTKGWNGVQCVPRELSLSEDGGLIQKVPKEYEALKAKEYILRNGTEVELDKATFEIKAQLNVDEELEISIEYGENKVSCWYKNGIFCIGEKEIQAKSLDGKVKLQLYFDISAMDTLMNETESLVLIVPPCTGSCKVTGKASNSNTVVWLWQYDGENLFSYYEDK